MNRLLSCKNNIWRTKTSWHLLSPSLPSEPCSWIRCWVRKFFDSSLFLSRTMDVSALVELPFIRCEPLGPVVDAPVLVRLSQCVTASCCNGKTISTCNITHENTSVNSKRSLSSTFPSHGSFFKQFHQSRPSWNSSEIELHGSHKQIFRNFFYRGIQSIQSALLLAIYPTAFPKPWYHSTLVNLQFINLSCRKKNVSQTLKTGLQITMIHFGEVFEVFWDVLGKVFRWSTTSRLQFHGTPRNPGAQLPWEPGPFPSFVAVVINRSTVHRRGPKKKTLK